MTHGLARLSAIEVYKGRPIFYGLGNYIFQPHILQPQRLGRFLPEMWESVVAECRFLDGRLVGATLRPVLLNEKGTAGERFFATRGVPRLVAGPVGGAILRRLAALSKPYGTNLAVSTASAELEIRR